MSSFAKRGRNASFLLKTIFLRLIISVMGQLIAVLSALMASLPVSAGAFWLSAFFREKAKFGRISDGAGDEMARRFGADLKTKKGIAIAKACRREMREAMAKESAKCSAAIASRRTKRAVAAVADALLGRR
jgi:hypothetical protein